MVTMSPWMQKILVGVIASLTAAGIAAWSNIVIKNNETSARIEAKVEDIGRDFDRFVDLRYQADMDGIGEDMARLDVRIDKALDRATGS